MIEGTLKEYLTAKGWMYKGKCTCDGKSDDYRKEGARIRCRCDNNGQETGRFRLTGKAPSGRTIGDVIGNKSDIETTLIRYGL